MGNEKVTNDEGGAAFASFVPDGHYNGSVHEIGMSLRDYFAAKAMQALAEKPKYVSGADWAARLSSRAYHIADAMLKARGI